MLERNLTSSSVSSGVYARQHIEELFMARLSDGKLGEAPARCLHDC